MDLLAHVLYYYGLAAVAFSQHKNTFLLLLSRKLYDARTRCRLVLVDGPLLISFITLCVSIYTHAAAYSCIAVIYLRYYGFIVMLFFFPIRSSIFLDMSCVCLASAFNIQ